MKTMRLKTILRRTAYPNTPKAEEARAKGIDIVSKDFILECAESGKRIDMDPFKFSNQSLRRNAKPKYNADGDIDEEGEGFRFLACYFLLSLLQTTSRNSSTSAKILTKRKRIKTTFQITKKPPTTISTNKTIYQFNRFRSFLKEKTNVNASVYVNLYLKQFVIGQEADDWAWRLSGCVRCGFFRFPRRPAGFTGLFFLFRGAVG